MEQMVEVLSGDAVSGVEVNELAVVDVGAGDATGTEVGRLRGYLREINPVRGYCFVRTDDQRDFFVHCTEIRASESKAAAGRSGSQWRRLMREGRLVEFTPVDNSEARKTNPKVRDRALQVVVLL